MATLRYLICVLTMCMLYPVAVLSQENDNNEDTLPELYAIPKGVMCGPSPVVLEGLEKVGETDVVFLGYHENIEPPDQIISVLHRNPNTGSFTVLETSIRGFSCMVSFGNINPPQPPREQEQLPDDGEKGDNKIKTKLPTKGGTAI